MHMIIQGSLGNIAKMPEKALYLLSNGLSYVLQDLNRRFGNVKVRKVSEEDEKDKNDPLKFFNQGLQQVHPMNVMNDQLKVEHLTAEGLAVLEMNSCTFSLQNAFSSLPSCPDASKAIYKLHLGLYISFFQGRTHQEHSQHEICAESPESTGQSPFHKDSWDHHRSRDILRGVPSRKARTQKTHQE